jgi:hypothetical protein
MKVLQPVALNESFSFHNRCDDYFALLKLFVQESLMLQPQFGPKNRPGAANLFRSTFDRLWTVFVAYRSFEFSANGVVDFALCGLLDMLRLLFSGSPAFRSQAAITQGENGVINEVFRRALWDTPAFNDKSAPSLPLQTCFAFLCLFVVLCCVVAVLCPLRRNASRRCRVSSPSICCSTSAVTCPLIRCIWPALF